MLTAIHAAVGRDATRTPDLDNPPTSLLSIRDKGTELSSRYTLHEHLIELLIRPSSSLWLAEPQIN